MTSYTCICLLCCGALNAQRPQSGWVCTETQTTAVSRLCSRKCSRPNSDLILFTHADILRSATVSNRSLPKRLWAITSKRITAAALCEAKMCLKHILCDPPRGWEAKRQSVKAANKWMQKAGACKCRFPYTSSSTEETSIEQKMQLKGSVREFDGWAAVYYLRLM